MLTFAPLPRWKHLIKSLYPLSVNERVLAANWYREGELFFWFSRSAWAMKAIVLWWESYSQRKSPSVWFPAYFCNQSLVPIQQTSARLFFYPVTKNLTPDWNRCKEYAKENPPDLFFIVHYFGYPSDINGATTFCNIYKAFLIEDAAHVLIPHSGIGKKGDFVFYSPHKHIAIPDGAILIMRPEAKGIQCIDINTATQIMKDVIRVMNADVSPFPWRWLLNRSFQKILPHRVYRLYIKCKKASFDDDPIDNPLSHILLPNRFGRRVLWYSIKDLQTIIFYKKNNNMVMDYLFGEKYSLNLFNGYKNRDYIPYLSVFQFDGRAEELFSELRYRGYPVHSWPDLPPEVKEKPDIYNNSIAFRKNLLCFPIHYSTDVNNLFSTYLSHKSSITPEELLEGKREDRLWIFSQRSKKKFRDNYHILWDSADRDAWETLFKSIEKSNLLQSWVYGEAKAGTENWRVKRGLIQRNGETIAIMQVLNRFYGRLCRINRGPLWLTQASEEDIEAVYALIRKHWGLKKGGILLIVPELLNTPKNLLMLSRLGYKIRFNAGYQSLWIELRSEEDELRKGLNRKWRNQLRLGEKMGLQFQVSFLEEDFKWLIKHYKEMLVKKRFKGISVNLLSSLFKGVDEENHLLIMKALYEGDTVAGILLIRHGNSCTYIIGWNDEKGRRLNANNFLLWNAVIEMKKRDCLWFDLGGIDDINTPGVSEFKRGMGGEEYQLIGEWW